MDFRQLDIQRLRLLNGREGFIFILRIGGIEEERFRAISEGQLCLRRRKGRIAGSGLFEQSDRLIIVFLVQANCMVAGA